MWYKNILLLLVAVTLLFVVGCSNEASESASDPSNSDSNDDYPTQPVKVIVGYSAGGGSDTAARILQPFLEDELGQSVVVENIPGAGGMIGATTLSREDADGYTLGNINQPALNFTMGLGDATYEPGDLVPFWIEVQDPNLWATTEESSWESMDDFITDVRENPGEYAVGVVPSGGQQANAVWLKNKLDLDFRIVNYDGGSDAGAALLGGQVDAIVGDAVSRSGMRDELKGLAIVMPEVNSLWPEADPLGDQLEKYDISLPQEEFGSRYGVYFVRKEFEEEYPERYETLLNAFQNATENPDYIKQMEEAGNGDLMVNQPGTDYIKMFEENYQMLEEEIIPLIENE